MFLIKEKRKHGTNLCIVQTYRDPVTKVSKTKRVMNVGYLEDLKNQYDDPIAHFRELAQQMSDEYITKSKPFNIALDTSKELQCGDNFLKNFGYAALSALYHELKLDVFFRGRQRSLNIDYSLNNIMKLLLYGRILYPGTEEQIFEKKDRFFDKMDFTLDDLYNSFKYLHSYRSKLQTWIHERICENYGRNTSQKYYFITNHYFEIGKQDLLSKNDISKKYRLDPIVQMGLFIDKDGLPISYSLFPKSTEEVLILNPALKKVDKNENASDKVVIVTDNGFNCTDSLYYLISSGHGYIVSQSIRSAKREIKEYVLNQDGYTPFGEEGKVKSRLYTRKIQLTTKNGIKKIISFTERQIVLYNEKYSRCLRAEREDVLMKAKSLIASPYKYNKATAYDATKYVKNIEYNKKTGEIIQGKHIMHLDEAKLKEEEKYDGYYIFLTSELDENVESIIDIYNCLWTIEESFKITDTYYGRPDFLLRNEHMHAHFLTCFVSLVLTRILEMKTHNKYPLDQMLQNLRKCNFVNIEGNHYVQIYHDSVLNHIGNSIGIDFSKKYMDLSCIKANIGATKKTMATVSGKV